MEENEALTAEQAALVQEDHDRDARVIPVIKGIYGILAELEDLKVGITPVGKTDEQHQQESVELYKDVSFKVMKLMIDNKVRMGEMKFLFQLAEGVVRMIEKNVNEITQVKHDEVVAKFFGVEFVEDISIEMLEQKLIENKAE